MNLLAKQEWLKGLFDFLFPPLCLGCGKYYEGDDSICEICHRNILEFEHPFCLTCDSVVPNAISCPVCKNESCLVYAFGDYRSPLKDIILDFKFRGITSPAKTFAGLIAEKFAKQFLEMEAQAVVPIPLHPGRRNHRGYNQAELLSRELALILELPLSEDSLFRIKRRRPQARLKFAKRKSLRMRRRRWGKGGHFRSRSLWN